MKYIHKFEEILGATILAAMTIITFTGAINRFTLRLSLPWTEEATRFLVMWMTMIGAALGVARSEHVGIDVIVNRLPQKVQFVIKQFMALVGIAFSCVFLYIGVLMVQKQYAQKSTALQISMGIVYACVIVGAVLMIIEFGYLFYKGIKERKQGGEENDG